MKNNVVYKFVIILVSFTIVVFSGCSSKIIGSEETSNYNGSVKMK